MYKEYDGDGIETPIVYEVKESYKGEIREAILDQYCFDTTLENEYEMTTDDGEATVCLTDWIEPFEVMKLNLISEHSKDDFWLDLTVEKLERVLGSRDVSDDVGDQIHEQNRDEREVA